MIKTLWILLLAVVSPLSAQVMDKQLLQQPGADWLTYNGSYNTERHSELKQITSKNVNSLVNQWVYHVPGAGALQCVPIVVDGVMYVTQPNEIFALDSRSGRLIWHYQHILPHAPDREGPNRGAAAFENKVYFTTTDALLIALNASNGNVLWQSKIAEWSEGYHSSAAPLVAKGKVLVGVIYGDRGLNGFLDAFDAKTGDHLWRFDSVPKPGELHSDSWAGDSWQHGGGATWLTGSYDPELGLVYWGIGNPSPDFNGDGRAGDNLYTDSIVALDINTGKLKWYFQFTPHDVMDWDGAELPVLVDAPFDGKMRKLMVQANRNGFLYVLDRTDGKFLFGRPYARKVTWATGLTPEGRPIVAPGKEPTPGGTVVCPWLNGATNWYSASWNPQTSLYYVQTNDKCGIFTRTDEPFQLGHGYMGGSNTGDPADPGRRVLRAFDIHTGKPVWELVQTGGAGSFGGVLSTAGGVVMFGADDDSFAAADAKTGKLLWSFPTNAEPHASPMTYLFDNKQYIAVALGANIIAFGLPDD